MPAAARAQRRLAPGERRAGRGPTARRMSAHRVAACRPWLRTAAGARCARRTTRTSRSRCCGCPARASRSAASTPGKSRRADAQRHERVVELGTVVARAHHRREVGGRVARAVLGAAHRGAARARSRACRRPRGRRGPPPARRSRARAWPRGRGGRSRSARRRRSRRRRRRGSACRPPARRAARRGRRPCRPSSRSAGCGPSACAHASTVPRGGTREVRGAHRALQRRAAQRAGAGAALVEHDQAIVVQQRAHARARARHEGDAALPGAAGEVDEHALGRVGVVGRRDGQAQLSRRAARSGRAGRSASSR